MFTINGLSNENTIEIFDVTGNLVYRIISKNTSVTIDIKEKNKGVYFYRIINALTKEVYEGKMLVD